MRKGKHVREEAGLGWINQDLRGIYGHRGRVYVETWVEQSRLKEFNDQLESSLKPVDCLGGTPRGLRA